MKYPINNLQQPKGMISIIMLLAVSALALAVVTTISTIAIDELRMVNAGGVIDTTFYAAESGLNEALYRMISDSAPNTYSFNLADVVIDIDISANPADPYQRIVTSTATDPNGNVRTVRVIANTSSFAGGFDYAVQGGAGGIFLDNNSLIVGDAYSNGNIAPASGGATGNISGNAWAAAGGFIDKVNITKNAYARTINRSDVEGEAFYTNIDAATKVGPANAVCPNSNCHSGQDDPDIRNMPISNTDVAGWIDEINALGNVLAPNPADCPMAYSSGFYCVTTNQTLGWQRIDGNFYLGNGAQLTLNGWLYVTGDIILDNNGTIQLDPVFGSTDATIIADGKVDINNNYTIIGSGDPASSIVMISSYTSPGGNSDYAIHASNNSASIIFAAINGVLRVKNNGSLSAAASKTLFLENNATVTFNPLLSSIVLGSGGGEDIGVALGTWEEL